MQYYRLNLGYLLSHIIVNVWISEITPKCLKSEQKFQISDILFWSNICLKKLISFQCETLCAKMTKIERLNLRRKVQTLARGGRPSVSLATGLQVRISDI